MPPPLPPAPSRPPLERRCNPRPLPPTLPPRRAPPNAMKFELDDDAVLRLSGVATAVYAATLLAVPRKSHDVFYASQAGTGRLAGRLGGWLASWAAGCKGLRIPSFPCP